MLSTERNYEGTGSIFSMHVNNKRKRTPNGPRTATGVHEEKHVSEEYGMQTLLQASFKPVRGMV